MDQTVVRSQQEDTGVLGVTFTETLNYANVKSLALHGGSIDTTFKVQSTPAGVPVTISAGSRIQPVTVGGSALVNQFIVGVNGSVKQVRSSLTLLGSGPSDTLVVDDSQALVQDQVTVTPTQVGAATTDKFFGAGGSLTYGGLSALTLNLSHAADDTVQLTPSATTAFFVNGDPTEFAAHHAAVLTLDLTGVINAVLNSTGPGNGIWTFGNRKAVTFQNLDTGNTN
jgi:hypothetical protein